MTDETTNEDRPPIQPEQEPSAPQETATKGAPRAEADYGLDPGEAELLGLDPTAPSDPWAAAALGQADPMIEGTEVDPLQLTRVEETGLKTHRVAERIARMLDPVEGSGGEDPSRIIIRHLRRLLRRMEAVEQSLERIETQLSELGPTGPEADDTSPTSTGPDPQHPFG